MRVKLTLDGSLHLRHQVHAAVHHYHHQAEEPPKPTNGQQGHLITVTYGDFTTQVRANQMSYKLPQGKRIVVQITYLDDAGNPAVVETVNWSSSNEQAAPVLPDTNDFTRAAIDGLEIASGIQINASADADLGSGTRELLTLFTLDVVGGEAVSGSIAVVGEPIDIPNGGTPPNPVDPGSPTPERPHIEQGLPGAPGTPYPQPQRR